MEAQTYSDSTAIYTVSQVAKRLGLSRSRFYQLQRQGVFPHPVYCIRSRKPLYTAGLLAQCRTVRKIGVGVNGELVRFYDKRQHKRRKPNPISKSLTVALRGMGLSVDLNQVNAAIQQLGMTIENEKAIEGDTIRKLFMHLHSECQKGV